MDFRLFFVALLVSATTVGNVQGQGGGLLEIVQTLLDEKITDPGIKQLVISKLPEIQGCLMGMVSMTPQVAMQVIDQMIPALNDCGTRISSASEDQRSAIYVSCSQEAVARVKTTTGMGADDAKIFDDGMTARPSRPLLWAGVTMRLKFLAALLLIINGAGLGRGQEGGLKEMLKKIVEEKVTDPYSKELFMSKFSDMQTCLLDMASMTPQVAMQ
ncbi:hypothetical protein V5799_013950, partial [Amblyomma americanum]